MYSMYFLSGDQRLSCQQMPRIIAEDVGMPELRRTRAQGGKASRRHKRDQDEWKKCQESIRLLECGCDCAQTVCCQGA